MKDVVLIVGAGPGLSAAIARRFSRDGAAVALAAREVGKLEPLSKETGAQAFTCDATRPESVNALFDDVVRKMGEPTIVIYNAGFRTRGPVAELDPAGVEKTIAICAFGGFLVAQAAARRMLPRGSGTILLTGASASVKGYAQSAPFAMGKFALRGLAQSMARELAPQGIHVAHVIVDGAIRPAAQAQDAARADSMLDADAIAENYHHLARQPRNSWTWEIEVRPWVEKF